MFFYIKIYPEIQNDLFGYHSDETHTQTVFYYFSKHHHVLTCHVSDLFTLSRPKNLLLLPKTFYAPNSYFVDLKIIWTTMMMMKVQSVAD